VQARVSTYASMPPDKLNDDQKRTLKTLPSLEAVQKELEEVKKAIEVHESEQVQELALKRVEAERAEKQRLRDAVDAAHTNHIAKTSDLLSFLRLHSLLSAGHSPALAPNLDAQEAVRSSRPAIFYSEMRGTRSKSCFPASCLAWVTTKAFLIPASSK